MLHCPKLVTKRFFLTFGLRLLIIGGLYYIAPFPELGGDYKANFSPGSERNPFEMKVAITWRRFLPAEKPHVIAAKFQPGLKCVLEQAH